jgi:hypothetical protein
MLTVVDVEAEANASAVSERTATGSNLRLQAVDSPAIAQNSGRILSQNSHPSYVECEAPALDVVVADPRNAPDAHHASENAGASTTIPLRIRCSNQVGGFSQAIRDCAAYLISDNFELLLSSFLMGLAT